MEDNEPERQLEALQNESDSLGDEISQVRDDWESKKTDPAVPGAGGDPLAAQSENPEAQFPAVGDSGDFQADHPDSGERLDPADPENEDL